VPITSNLALFAEIPASNPPTTSSDHPSLRRGRNLLWMHQSGDRTSVPYSNMPVDRQSIYYYPLKYYEQAGDLSPPTLAGRAAREEGERPRRRPNTYQTTVARGERGWGKVSGLVCDRIVAFKGRIASSR
jgi:hypothetical protein